MASQAAHQPTTRQADTHSTQHTDPEAGLRSAPRRPSSPTARSVGWCSASTQCA